MLCAVVLPLVLGLSGIDAEVVDRAAASVDGEVITWSDLVWLAQYRSLSVPEAPAAKQAFFSDLLDQVIDQKVISAEAEQTPFITITDQDVEARLAAYRSRFPSEEAFSQRLTEMETTPFELRQLIRRQLAVNQFVEVRVKPFVIVLPDEIDQYYNQELIPRLNQQRQPIPPLELVEESVRQILTEQKTNLELDQWLSVARRKSKVVRLLDRTPPLGANLPDQLRKAPDLLTLP